ncbi:dTDP-4-dehydrorhamnose 3,5-epimerase [Salinimicrobium catena]|uniref:dTDP-4-dehydrorhamnose 3,5-epimerase n=1 Tax=Salinimicrobium catena TaxID=390640 RepID=A0A1H5IGR5_9FLAO|nr:dTDP-4-dehydrorhamnose 3,5-epimerase [Salinimicrobium catena]SDK77615.1 dTDP-4-dehydrorhamnose 3,5-epimerase [Salinimicrobium catena]SEE39345.1 dTDP-4-dehydrorhamnose 3,5-epimerase [Salinimicrobium catena]
MLEIENTPLKDCFILKPSVFKDHRGTFMESFSQRRFEEVTGLHLNFVQDNQSTSTKGVLRGLHFQKGKFAQAKLVRAVVGEILDVVVDLRPDSPTYLKSFKVILSNENQYQLFVPAGFAHGFLTRSETSVFAYKCDQYYHKDSDAGIIWKDPTLNIDWEMPEEELILSEKDKQLPTLESLGL